MGLFDKWKKTNQPVMPKGAFIEIPAGNVIKEATTENLNYLNQRYIVYISPDDSRWKIHINTYYSFQGNSVWLCVYYDRGLCETLEEYQKLPIEHIESQAYGSWMDGAR